MSNEVAKKHMYNEKEVHVIEGVRKHERGEEGEKGGEKERGREGGRKEESEGEREKVREGGEKLPHLSSVCDTICCHLEFICVTLPSRPGGGGLLVIRVILPLAVANCSRSNACEGKQYTWYCTCTCTLYYTCTMYFFIKCLHFVHVQCAICTWKICV